MSEEDLLREYYAILDIVGEFDKRILTIKGWGVTLSLAALAWGFQYKHYGLFLVAALSGLAFWLIEGVFKRHQMRYYFRMRQIEVLRYQEAEARAQGSSSTPRIDSSWSAAGRVYSGQHVHGHPVMSTGPHTSYRYTWLFGHVMLPHILSVGAGIVFFLCAHSGYLGFGPGWHW